MFVRLPVSNMVVARYTGTYGWSLGNNHVRHTGKEYEQYRSVRISLVDF